MNDEFGIFYLAIGLFVLAEIGYLMYHFISKRNQLRWILQDDGEQSNSFSKDELAFVKKESLRQGEFLIDEITWNDLSMDDIYQSLNRCLSSAGDQALYGMLRKPLLDPLTIKERKEIMNWFQAHPETRRQLRSQCFRIGGQCERALDDFYQVYQHSMHLNVKVIYLLVAMMFISIVAAFLHPAFALSPIAVLIANIVISMLYRKNHSYAFLSANHLIRYVQCIMQLQKMEWSETVLQRYPIERLATSLSSLEHSLFPDLYQGDGLILLLGKNVFCGEMLSFARLYNSLWKHQTEVLEAIQVIGELEALMSASAYFKSQSTLCEACFVDGKKMQATQMVHPLLNKPIPNDVIAQKNILISGSNASGKSTFLKMIAINAILAQSFGYALAKTYEATCFHIMTSMSLKDSIEQQESYFMAEVRSLKRMMDQAKKEVPLLCLIDEILRGTNTGERIAAASAILAKFAQPQILCIAATHDLELTTILNQHYENMHFSEDMEKGEMKFSYQIQTGPSNSHNALPLLQNLGFSDALMQDARLLRETYEQKGYWSWEGKEKEQ